MQLVSDWEYHQSDSLFSFSMGFETEVIETQRPTQKQNLSEADTK